MDKIEELEDKIYNSTIELRELERELVCKKIEKLKEQYGSNIKCRNCAYSCSSFIDTCLKEREMLFDGCCELYIPENEISAYLRDTFPDNINAYEALNILFGTSDLFESKEYYDKAIEILKILDREEE